MPCFLFYWELFILIHCQLPPAIPVPSLAAVGILFVWFPQFLLLKPSTVVEGYSNEGSLMSRMQSNWPISYNCVLFLNLQHSAIFIRNDRFLFYNEYDSRFPYIIKVFPNLCQVISHSDRFQYDRSGAMYLPFWEHEASTLQL